MFYENLIAVCRERGTTPTTALKACGFATGSLGSWKKGKWPNSEIVVSLAAHLNVSTDRLLIGEDATKAPPMEVRGISDEGLKIGCLWDNLDEPGKAIILGKIYERLEGSGDADHADGRGLKRA